MDALDESIAHYDRLISGEDTHFGASDCTLCSCYIYRGCQGCPVMAETKRRGCIDTPWAKLYQHARDVHELIHSVVTECRECQRLLRLERDFLRSLRDVKEIAALKAPEVKR